MQRSGKKAAKRYVQAAYKKYDICLLSPLIRSSPKASAYMCVPGACLEARRAERHRRAHAHRRHVGTAVGTSGIDKALLTCTTSMHMSPRSTALRARIRYALSWVATTLVADMD